MTVAVCLFLYRNETVLTLVIRVALRRISVIACRRIVIFLLDFLIALLFGLLLGVLFFGLGRVVGCIRVRCFVGKLVKVGCNVLL